MGADIHGWVEYFAPLIEGNRSEWQAAFELPLFVSRSYDMFGILFGVRNVGQFPSVSVERGLPPDLSPFVRGEAERAAEWAHSHSWIRLDEIQAIRWGRLATKRKVHYRREGGMLEQVGYSLAASDQELDTTTERGDWVSRVEMMTGTQIMSGQRNWRLLFKLMGVLGREFGDRHVRMVVWFDD